ncbi:hypothetical protein IKG28_00790 [Candidatus Saccharibacteria bacterium]|nr:hypothetical protein [Candidatus Saccharibacteria bacterium]
MVSDARRRKGNSNAFWFVFLGVLSVAIVVLTAVIIIKTVNKNNTSEQAPEYEATSEQIERTETLQEIRERVASADSWEEYIDKKISEYEGKDEEIEVKNIKVYRLVFEGRIAEALEILDAIDVDNLSEYNKIQYYLAMAEVSRSSGDTVGEERYMKLMEEVRDNYYASSEGAGGE